MTGSLTIYFGEDKTKSILFSPKNQRKRADPIVIKRHNVTLKQFSTVGYLGCLLDETLSGREMALKVLKRLMVSLGFYIGRENILIRVSDECYVTP